MDANERTALVAAGLTTASFLPQVWHTWRTRSAGDISVLWIIFLAGGMAMWILYGVSIGTLPVVLGNAITLILVGIIAGVKFGPHVSARLTS